MVDATDLIDAAEDVAESIGFLVGPPGLKGAGEVLSALEEFFLKTVRRRLMIERV